ncbi:MAG: hypothetical protein ACLQU1_37530 [Bryobacteraceae bacterium]
MRQEKDLGGGSKIVAVSAEMPMILDKVEYIYVAYSQFMVTAGDLRIAFGDRLPPDGNVKPSMGIIMSHHHAKEFFAAIHKLQAAFENFAQTEAIARSLLNPTGGAPGQPSDPVPDPGRPTPE